MNPLLEQLMLQMRSDEGAAPKGVPGGLPEDPQARGEMMSLSRSMLQQQLTGGLSTPSVGPDAGQPKSTLDEVLISLGLQDDVPEFLRQLLEKLQAGQKRRDPSESQFSTPVAAQSSGGGNPGGGKTGGGPGGGFP